MYFGILYYNLWKMWTFSTVKHSQFAKAFQFIQIHSVHFIWLVQFIPSSEEHLKLPNQHSVLHPSNAGGANVIGYYATTSKYEMPLTDSTLIHTWCDNKIIHVPEKLDQVVGKQLWLNSTAWIGHCCFRPCFTLWRDIRHSWHRLRGLLGCWGHEILAIYVEHCKINRNICLPTDGKKEKMVSQQMQSE